MVKIAHWKLPPPRLAHPPPPPHSIPYNYPIKPALMTPLSFCPEASPHSVCKVRVPSFPQFDSVKAWKQIKACCFSLSRADTEPVRTRLTRGSFATCCFFVCDEAWGMLAQVWARRFFCRVFFFPSHHQHQQPSAVSVIYSGNVKLSFSKLFFFYYYYDSNDGLVMFAVGQCVWQRSLCPVKALPLDRPWNVAKLERTGCSEILFCEWLEDI